MPLVLLGVLVGNATAGQQPVVLLTAEEASLADAPAGLFEIGRPLQEGPEIELIKPEDGGTYKAPLAIVVRFIPHGANGVDLSTFKVEYLKFLAVDITQRILPFTTKEGINIESAELPSGNHKIRLTIGDIVGGVSQRIFQVKIL